MSRVYNFAAGPAALPLEVLQNAQKDLVDYKADRIFRIKRGSNKTGKLTHGNFFCMARTCNINSTVLINFRKN